MTCHPELADGKNPGISAAPIFLLSFPVRALMVSNQPLLYSAFDVDGRSGLIDFGLGRKLRKSPSPLQSA